MFCERCGKPIEDNNRFCTHCGAKVEGRELPPPTVSNKVPKKKWKVPLIIGICIVTVGVVSVLGGMALQKRLDSKVAQKRETEVTKRPVVEKTENPKKIENTENVMKEPEFPKEMTLSDEQIQGIANLLEIVCEIDGSNMGKNLQGHKEIDHSFAENFLFCSIWDEVPFVNGKAVETTQTGWNIPEEIAKTYLQNSIHISEIQNTDLMQLSDGMVQVKGVTPTAAFYAEYMSLDQVMQVSEYEFSVQGEIQFTSEIPGDIPYAVEFEVLLEKNPESMWAGHTLKEIRRWEVLDKSFSEMQIATVSLEDSRNQLSRVSLANIVRLTASSVLQEEGYDHSVENLIDHNASTCWAEGAYGIGEQENVIFSFQEPQEVSGVSILPGYLKSQSHYEKNGIPVEIRITCGTKMWKKVILQDFIPNYEDPMGAMLYIDFRESVKTERCIVTILNACSGGKYEDLCISEMDLYRIE